MEHEIISIQDLKEGMIINEDVTNHRGNVLLKEGTVVSDELISRLKSLNVSRVCVVSIEGNGKQRNAPLVSMTIENLERKFLDVRDNEIMREIESAVKDYIIERDGTNGREKD